MWGGYRWLLGPWVGLVSVVVAVVVVSATAAVVAAPASIVVGRTSTLVACFLIHHLAQSWALSSLPWWGQGVMMTDLTISRLVESVERLICGDEKWMGRGEYNNQHEHILQQKNGMINMSCLHFGTDIKAVLTTDRPTDGTKRSADRLTERASNRQRGRPTTKHKVPHNNKSIK